MTTAQVSRAARPPRLRTIATRPPQFAPSLLAACALLFATGCAHVGPQRANVAPLRDLPVSAADVPSLLPLFPDAVRMTPHATPDVLQPPAAEIMVAGGIHLGSNTPYDGVRDWLTLTRLVDRPDNPFRYARAEVRLYSDRAAADAAFEFARDAWHFGRDAAAGTPGDRYELTKVRQGTSDTWQRLDHYWSKAAFQKGNVVVEITECSADPAGSRKDGLIADIARAFTKPPAAH